MIEPKLRLPPFGKIVEAYQQERIKLEIPIYIFIGQKAFNEALACKSIGSMCLYLPFKEDSQLYKWPIFNQKIVIIDTGGLTQIELKKICFTFLKYEPRLIYLYSNHGNEFIQSHKESDYVS